MQKFTVTCLVLGFVILITGQGSHLIDPAILSGIGGVVIGLGLTTYLLR